MKTDGPLLFAIAAFTVVSLSVGVMFDLVSHRRIGLPVTVAVQVMALAPSFLSSPPMAMATLLAYAGSLPTASSALRSVGVSTVAGGTGPGLAILLTGLTWCSTT